MKKLLFFSFFLVMSFVQQALAQDRTVTGTVTDSETNQGLPGVAVLVKGTTIGTATDIDGNFSISVPEGSNTLQFRFIGYKVIERSIDNQSTITVSMAPDAKQLDEVVVTALGVEKEERALGYATSEVQEEEITKGRATNPMSALQGKVAGVNISTASGSPGASTKVILRGYSSISGNNNPLYVIDGVPINNTTNNFNEGANSVTRTQDFGNSANDINPDDIESISILKGASATALYGSRAANGVIMITTKKGRKSEKVRVNYTGSATFTSPLRLPQLQNTFGQGWSGTHDLHENGSWGPKFDGRERLWGNVVDNSQLLKPFVAQEDNIKDFYDVGTSYMNTIALSGGSEKTTYYASYSNTSEDGIIPTDADSYKRNTLSLRGTTTGNRISVSSSLNFVRKDARVVTTGQGGSGASMFQELIQIPRGFSIVDMSDVDDPFYNLDNFYTPYAQNPYYALYNNRNDFEENRMYGNINFGYEFTDWLKFNLRGGGDVGNSTLKDWVAVAPITPGSPNAEGGVSTTPGRVDEKSFLRRELNIDAILTASRDLTEDISLTGLLGYNVNERYARSQTAYVTNLDIPGFYNLSNSAQPIVAGTGESTRRIYGVYGQAEFSYRSFLFLSVLARNDWSSTLPTDNNSFFYPGVNGSFVFTDVVPALENVFSFGKIRAAWGKTGNDAPPYSVFPVFVSGNVGLPFGQVRFPVSGINAFEVSNQLGNLALEPEITSEWEIGANLKFFNNRAGFDITYYNRNTTGQILSVPIAASSGATSKVLNFGDVENKGLEIALTGTPVQTDNFSWDVRYTFANNRNKVLELREGLDEVILTGAYNVNFVAEVGQPLGVFKGPGFQYTPDGRILVNENTGLPLATEEKVTYGNAQADFTMGLYNTFNYNNFSLSFGFDWRKGGLMYSYTQNLTQFVGNSTNTLYNDRQPFIIPNTAINTGTEESPVYAENTTAILPADVWSYYYFSNPTIDQTHVIDRSYVKLRELTLSYTVPKSMYENLPLENLTLSVVGRNLFLWTPDENNIIDPESTTFGNDLLSEFGEFGVGPTVRSVGGSIRVSF